MSPETQATGAAWLSRLRHMPRSWRSAGVPALLVLLGVIASAGNALVLVTVAVAAVMFTLAALRPKLMLWVVILTTMLVPSYVRVGVPGLPMVPASLAVTAVLAAALILESFLGRAGPPCGPDGRRLGRAFILFSALTLVSMLDAKTAVGSVTWWVKAFAAPATLCLIILRLLNSTHDLTRLFNVMSAGGLIAVIYAIGEFITNKNILLAGFLGGTKDLELNFEWPLEGDQFARYDLLHRVFSFFGNPIEFSALLSMVYPYCLLQLIYAGSPRARLGWAALAALMVVANALTFSRGPMMALVVCTILLAAIVKPLRRYVAYGCVAVAIAIAAAWPWIGDKLEERTLGSENITLRLKLWSIAAHMALDHPLLGVGFGNFDEYRTETIRSHQIIVSSEPWAERVQTADNTYLHLAAECGVIGLMAFLGVFALFFMLAVRLYRRYPQGAHRILILASAASAAAFLINGLTMTMYQSYVIPVMMGAFFAALMILERKAPRPAD